MTSLALVPPALQDIIDDNQLKLRGYTVLRFPSALVRQRPDYVAAQIRDALEAAPGNACQDRRRAG